MLRGSFSRTTHFKNSFTVNGAKLRHSLPIELREIPYVNSFKTL